MRLGFLEEAASFMDWLQKRCETATADRDVMIMYTVDGSDHIPEMTLDHLEGYHGARPVRIGNGAVGQRQLDVYGEIMDSVYLFNKEVPISYDLWIGLSKRLDWLSRHWTEPDEGIWEIRGPRQRFTYSALMTWVAYDRAGPPGPRPRPARAGRALAQAGRAGAPLRPGAVLGPGPQVPMSCTRAASCSTRLSSSCRW